MKLNEDNFVLTGQWKSVLVSTYQVLEAKYSAGCFIQAISFNSHYSPTTQISAFPFHKEGNNASEFKKLD